MVSFPTPKEQMIHPVQYVYRLYCNHNNNIYVITFHYVLVHGIYLSPCATLLCSDHSSRNRVHNECICIWQQLRTQGIHMHFRHIGFCHSLEHRMSYRIPRSNILFTANCVRARLTAGLILYMAVQIQVGKFVIDYGWCTGRSFLARPTVWKKLNIFSILVQRPFAQQCHQ